MGAIYDLALPYNKTPEYAAKMLHTIPEAPVIDRIEYILRQCHGKRVLNLGCVSGGLHQAIQNVAASVVGIDKQEPCDFMVDLDSAGHPVPQSEFDIVVAGEILEHLSNPGQVLQWVRSYHCQLLITVPNAFCEAGFLHAAAGTENVNIDHVAYYSYWTLKQLVERYGFSIQEFRWYNGKPRTAEGLIFLVE